MAKQPTRKNHDKDEESHRETHSTTRAHTQAIPQPAAAQPRPVSPPAPMPRPIFGAQPRGDRVVPGEAQQVINALQQTVRSQAILIRNYQALLQLAGMDDTKAAPEEGEDGEPEAA